MYSDMYTSGEYLAKNPTWHVEDSLWKSKQILKIIRRNNLHPKSVCEIGCGAGEILNQLHSQMPKDVSFVGYEISPQAFELSQQRQKDRLHFHLANLLEETSIYDLTLAIDVFEHIDDYLGFLKKLRTKSSYKIFHIPLDISIQSILRGSQIIKLRKHFGHIHYFTKETALATLTDMGYEIVDYFYTAGPIDLPAKTPKAIMAQQLRKISFKLNKDLAVRFLGGFSLMVLTK